jgi:hypothetical protein
MTQASMFEFSDSIDKMFDVGDTVYRVTLDIVEEFRVVDTFDVFYRDENAKRTRYHVNSVSGVGCDVFGFFDIGRTYFSDFEEAYAKARDNFESGLFAKRNLDEEVIVESWARELVDRDGTLRHMYVALTEAFGGYGVLWKGPYTYRFMDEFDSLDGARAAYREKLEELRREGDGFMVYEVQLDVRLVDPLYGSGDGRWASPEYANRWYLSERRD